jgi:hypothetical protein
MNRSDIDTLGQFFFKNHQYKLAVACMVSRPLSHAVVKDILLFMQNEGLLEYHQQYVQPPPANPSAGFDFLHAVNSIFWVEHSSQVLLKGPILTWYLTCALSTRSLSLVYHILQQRMKNYASFLPSQTIRRVVMLATNFDAIQAFVAQYDFLHDLETRSPESWGKSSVSRRASTRGTDRDRVASTDTDQPADASSTVQKLLRELVESLLVVSKPPSVFSQFSGRILSVCVAGLTDGEIGAVLSHLVVCLKQLAAEGLSSPGEPLVVSLSADSNKKCTDSVLPPMTVTTYDNRQSILLPDSAVTLCDARSQVVQEALKMVGLDSTVHENCVVVSVARLERFLQPFSKPKAAAASDLHPMTTLSRVPPADKSKLFAQQPPPPPPPPAVALETHQLFCYDQSMDSAEADFSSPVGFLLVFSIFLTAAGFFFL